MTAVTQTVAFSQLDEQVVKEFIKKAAQSGAFKYWLLSKQANCQQVHQGDDMHPQEYNLHQQEDFLDRQEEYGVLKLYWIK